MGSNARTADSGRPGEVKEIIEGSEIIPIVVCEQSLAEQCNLGKFRLEGVTSVGDVRWQDLPSLRQFSVGRKAKNQSAWFVREASLLWLGLANHSWTEILSQMKHERRHHILARIRVSDGGAHSSLW